MSINSLPTPITDLSIYEVVLTALVPLAKNPRKGDIKKIAESLKVNGQYRPLVVRKETREILAGNHTYKAAVSLKWEKIKVMFVEGITDEAASKIILTDNRTADLGEYSDEILKELLSGLTDLTGTGYDLSFLTELVEDKADIEEDFAPPVSTYECPKCNCKLKISEGKLIGI
jgi:ParB-like chromosome segregation protein Spo0J